MQIPLGRLQDEVNSPTFSLYMAYDRIDPHSRERFDLGFGIVADTISRVYGNNSKPADFMPDFDKEPAPKKTDEQMANIFKQWAKNG